MSEKTPEQDAKALVDLIRQKYATSGMSSISAKPLTVESLSRPMGLISRSMDLVTGKVTRDEYIKANLADEMRKHRGKKRLRKKKAKRSLRMRWGFLQMGRLLSRRVNYAEIARKLVVVEPLPDPVKPIYMRDIDIADAVTGGEE